jgi:hypothetical protein
LKLEKKARLTRKKIFSEDRRDWKIKFGEQNDISIMRRQKEMEKAVRSRGIALSMPSIRTSIFHHTCVTKQDWVAVYYFPNCFL